MDAEKPEDLKAKCAGKRVRFVGMFGKTDGPEGKCGV